MFYEGITQFILDEAVPYYILNGFHLVFVFCLVLATATLDTLIRRVAGFVIGYTIALIATVGFVLPGWFPHASGAVIAASILYFAWKARKEPTDNINVNMALIVTLVLGLFHGFKMSVNYSILSGIEQLKTNGAVLEDASIRDSVLEQLQSGLVEIFNKLNLLEEHGLSSLSTGFLDLIQYYIGLAVGLAVVVVVVWFVTAKIREHQMSMMKPLRWIFVVPSLLFAALWLYTEIDIFFHAIIPTYVH